MFIYHDSSSIQQSYPADSSPDLFLKLASLGGIAAVLLQEPENYRFATGLAANLGRSFFRYGARVREQVYRLTPLSARHIQIGKENLAFAGKVARHALIIACECADKLMPTIDSTAETSIEASMKRISAHNLSLAKCFNFLGDEISKVVLDKILLLIEEWDEDSIIDDPMSGLTSFFLSWNSELIGQTVKANIMHIIANLTEQVYEEGYQFKDGERNPIGRLISLLSRTFQAYESRLRKADALTGVEQTEVYQQLFRQLSSDLLAKCFPEGVRDLQLYHPVLPGMHLAKECIWQLIEGQLPAFLEQLYKETRPLGEEWKEKFNANTFQGYEAETLMDLPSSLVESKIRKNKGEVFNALFPKIEMALRVKGYSRENAGQLSRHLTRYLKEFFLTKDSSLLKIGASIDCYFTERLLANFSYFKPSNALPNGDFLFIPTAYVLLGELMDVDLFEAIFNHLAGCNVETGRAEATVGTFVYFLDPELNHFPLPPMLREKVWPSMKEMLITKGGAALIDAIPRWDSLINCDENITRLNTSLGDSLFTDSVGRLADKWGRDLFQKLYSSENPLILLFIRTLNSKSEEKQEVPKEIFARFLKALLFQISQDIYKEYDSSLVEDYYELRSLFSENDAEAVVEEGASDRRSFSAWLTQNIVEACSVLSIDHLTRREVVDLNDAIRLRRLLLEAKDPVEKKNGEVAFNRAWEKVKPKFDAVLFRILEVFKYKEVSDLPFPALLQPLVWGLIVDSIPRFLFDEIGEVIQVSIEKEDLKRDVGALPGGDLLVEGCHLLVQDITRHLPEWTEGHLNQFPESLSNKFPELRLSSSLGDNLVEALKSIVRGDESYAPVMQGVGVYLEALLLKVALNVTKMEGREWRALQLIVEEARDQKDEDDDEEDSAAILNKLGDGLLQWAGVEAPHHLFGLPESLQTLLYSEVKMKLAQRVLDLDSMIQGLYRVALDQNSIEDYLPESDVARSLSSIVRYVLDRATDQLSERVDGEMRGVSQLYTFLSPVLTEKEEEGYDSAAFLKRKIVEGAPTSLIERLLSFLDSSETHPYREAMAAWISPLLKGYASFHLSELLQKERAGNADFDQSLLMAVLPTLSRHLECLNQAAHREGGVNSENYAQVAGEDLHADATQFYKNQASILFNLIFPRGIADLKTAMPSLDIADETFDLIQEKVESVVADQLPTVIETLFDREILVFIFSTVLENVNEVLQAPIEISSPRTVILTPDEEASQKKMDEEVGKLILQAAIFINLPSQIFKGISFESIGANIREKFNGRLFHDILPLAFEKMEAKKHEKKSVEERKGEAVQGEKDLKSLQTKLASSAIAYLFNYLGARIDHATDIFMDPRAKMCRDAIISVSRFVLVDLIGGLLRICKVDQAAAYLLSCFLDRTVEKSISVFKQAKLQENFVCRSVEAIEKVINKP